MTIWAVKLCGAAADTSRMNEETLGETVLGILVAMVLAIVLALIIMGAAGISFRPPERPHRHAVPTVVRTDRLLSRGPTRVRRMANHSRRTAEIIEGGPG